MMTDGIPHQVQPFYGVPLSTLAAFFDSVYVSFYKGLGAMAGAMLLGDEATVAAARVWQKRRGGDVFTRGPLALSCEMAFRAAVLRQPLPHRPPSSRLSLFGGAVLSHFGGASAGALPLSFEARYARLRHCVALVQRLAGEYATRHSFRHSSDALPNTAPQPLLFFDPPAPNTAPQPLLFLAAAASDEGRGVTLVGSMGYLWAVLFTIPLNALAALLLGGMTLHQLVLVLFNRTTLAPNDARYDVGFGSNWRVVFGSNPWLWPLPLLDVERAGVDGVHWEESARWARLQQRSESIRKAHLEAQHPAVYTATTSGKVLAVNSRGVHSNGDMTGPRLRQRKAVGANANGADRLPRILRFSNNELSLL